MHLLKKTATTLMWAPLVFVAKRLAGGAYAEFAQSLDGLNEHIEFTADAIFGKDAN